MRRKIRHLCAALAAASLCAVAPARAQTGAPAKAAPSSAASFDAETLEHFQALVRMDTSDPPGNEQPAADT